jgi:hypothetical protein
MTIYLNDNRDYSPIIERWVHEFRETLDDDPANGDLRPGDESGDTIPGIKIIFDGYGENDDGTADGLNDEGVADGLNDDGTADGLNDDDIDPPKPFNGFISDDDDNTLALIDKFNINDSKKKIIIILIYHVRYYFIKYKFIN